MDKLRAIALEAEGIIEEKSHLSLYVNAFIFNQQALLSIFNTKFTQRQLHLNL
ncbi:hypothetical protein ACP6PL_09890 [Dapis sp. BLCC M126]|uniref:hypothetical protein n=1 Tax=Dapis sp. BLCC M126 TaxID=3400189 RepID=UPI003CEE1E6D